MFWRRHQRCPIQGNHWVLVNRYQINNYAISGVSTLGIAWAQANTANVAKATAQPPETPFSKSKKSRRGKFKKYAKGFSGGAPAGLPAQAARLTHSPAGTGFARKCKIAPFWEKNGNCRPLGRFFLWRRVAPASCFSGGNEIWSASKLAHFFVFGRRSRHAPRRGKIEVDTINQ